jgi:hypothetical protein
MSNTDISLKLQTFQSEKYLRIWNKEMEWHGMWNRRDGAWNIRTCIGK